MLGRLQKLVSFTLYAAFIVSLCAAFTFACGSQEPKFPELKPCTVERNAAITAACSTLIIVECKKNDETCPMFQHCIALADAELKKCKK